MKPYETGICVCCGKKKEEHASLGSYYNHSKMEQEEGGLFCRYTSGSPSEVKFLDSGTAHLCSEEVASKMLEALQNARELINKQHCTGKVSAKEEIDTMSNIDKAINEALKR